MELKEAIERIKELQDSLILIFAEEEELSEAIDTVLEELNNRIPREDVINKIEGLRKEIRNEEEPLVAAFKMKQVIGLEELLNKE